MDKKNRNVMDVLALISALSGLLLGGGLVSIFTLKSVKKKSSAEAKTSELDNVEMAIRIWRDMCEKLNVELLAANDDRSALRDELAESRLERQSTIDELHKLRKQVSVLGNNIQKMVKLLDKITPTNIQEMISKIKNINEQA